MDKGTADILIRKYLEGACTSAEKAQVEQFFLEDLEASGEVPSVERIEAATTRIGHRLQTHLEAGRKRSRVRQLSAWLSAAAAVLLLAGGGYWYFARQIQRPATQASLARDIAPGGNKAVLTLSGGQRIVLNSAHLGTLAQAGNVRINKIDSGSLAYVSSGNQATGVIGYNTLSTPRGGQYQLVLPDGTHVWLNAASSVTYPTAFTGTTREVTVTGEVYFEVVHNTHQPFRVKAGGQVIEDVGTTFNINAYNDEPAIKTTLVQGAVKVDGVLLEPGQQAAVVNNQVKVSRADVEQTLAWKNGLFSFTDADVYTVMRQLARWYNVDVSYAGSIPEQNFQFNGEIGRSLTLAQVLDVLSHSRVHYTIEGSNKLIIRP